MHIVSDTILHEKINVYPGHAAKFSKISVCFLDILGYLQALRERWAHTFLSQRCLELAVYFMLCP